jgi:hypothetical protein
MSEDPRLPSDPPPIAEYPPTPAHDSESMANNPDANQSPHGVTYSPPHLELEEADAYDAGLESAGDMLMLLNEAADSIDSMRVQLSDAIAQLESERAALAIEKARRKELEFKVGQLSLQPTTPHSVPKDLLSPNAEEIVQEMRDYLTKREDQHALTIQSLRMLHNQHVLFIQDCSDRLLNEIRQVQSSDIPNVTFFRRLPPSLSELLWDLRCTEDFADLSREDLINRLIRLSNASEACFQKEQLWRESKRMEQLRDTAMLEGDDVSKNEASSCSSSSSKENSHTRNSSGSDSSKMKTPKVVDRSAIDTISNNEKDVVTAVRKESEAEEEREGETKSGAATGESIAQSVKIHDFDAAVLSIRGKYSRPVGVSAAQSEELGTHEVEKVVDSLSVLQEAVSRLLDMTKEFDVIALQAAGSPTLDLPALRPWSLLLSDIPLSLQPLVLELRALYRRLEHCVKKVWESNRSQQTAAQAMGRQEQAWRKVFQSWEKTCADLGDEYRTLQNKVHNERALVAKAEVANDEHDVLVRRSCSAVLLQQECLDVTKKWRQCQEEIASLKQQLGDKKRRVDQLKSDNAAHQRALEKVRGECSKYREEVEETRLALQLQSGHADSEEKTIEALKAEVSRERRIAQTLREALQVAKKNNGRLSSENARLYQGAVRKQVTFSPDASSASHVSSESRTPGSLSKASDARRRPTATS